MPPPCPDRFIVQPRWLHRERHGVPRAHRISTGGGSKTWMVMVLISSCWWFWINDKQWLSHITWFGTFFIFFPYIGNNNPSWPIFFRGGWNHQPVKVVIILDNHDYELMINDYSPILDLWKSLTFMRQELPLEFLWDTPNSATAMSHEPSCRWMLASSLRARN